MNDVRTNILYDRNNTAYYVHNNDGDANLRTLSVSQLNVDGYLFAETSSRGVAAGNWYTIAECSSGGAFGTFHVWDGNSGRHGSMKFTAGISYGSVATITMLGKSWYSSGGIFDNIRIRRSGTYDRHYLQIYISTSGTLNYAITEAFSRSNRWVLTQGPTGNPGSTTAAELNAPDSYRGLYTSAQIGAREEIYSERQFRGPIYYDSNDTNYYSDPNSTSRMNYINANHYALNDGWDIYDDNGSAMSIRSNNSDNGIIYFRDSGNTVCARLRFDDDANNLELQVSNGERALRADPNSVTRLYYNNSQKFYTESSGIRVEGEVRATGDVIAYYSDERLKDIEGNIENALDKVGKLRGFYYRNNKEANFVGYQGNDLQIGLSAQDVKSILPEIVKPAPLAQAMGYDYMTVQYEKIAPLLVNAINEQREIVETQKEEIEYLKSELSEMKEMMKQLLNKK